VKLLIENWRKFLNEETGDEVLARFSDMAAKDPVVHSNTLWRLEMMFTCLAAIFRAETRPEEEHRIPTDCAGTAEEVIANWWPPLGEDVERLNQIDRERLDPPVDHELDELIELLADFDKAWSSGTWDAFLTAQDDREIPNIELIQDYITTVWNEIKAKVRPALPEPKPPTWAQRTMATDPSLAQTAEEPAEYRISPIGWPKK